MNFKNLFKWLVAPVVAFSLLLFLLVPAHAEAINYNDYVSSAVVDGANELVTITIPKSYAYIQIFEIDESGNIYTLVASGYGNVDYNFKTYTEYRVTVFPLGPRNTANNGLDLAYIPNQSTIETGFGFDFENTPSFISSGNVYVEYLYFPYDSTSYLEIDTHDLGKADNYYNFIDTYVTNPVVNGNILNIEWYYDSFDFFDNTPTGVYVNDTRMTITISSLIRQHQLTGETNKLLDEVSRQLEDQGIMLDDIIYGEVGAVDPDGSSDINDFIEQEDQLIDDIQDYYDSGFSLVESASNVLVRLGSAFQSWKYISGLTVLIPFANDLIVVFVSIGLVGFLIGLLPVITRAGADRSSGGRSKKGGG